MSVVFVELGTVCGLVWL